MPVCCWSQGLLTTFIKTFCCCYIFLQYALTVQYICLSVVQVRMYVRSPSVCIFCTKNRKHMFLKFHSRHIAIKHVSNISEKKSHTSVSIQYSCLSPSLSRRLEWWPCSVSCPYYCMYTSNWNCQKVSAKQLLPGQVVQACLFSFYHSTNHTSFLLSSTSKMGKTPIRVSTLAFLLTGMPASLPPPPPQHVYSGTSAAGIFKLLSSPGIDSKESIPQRSFIFGRSHQTLLLAYMENTRKQFMGAWRMRQKTLGVFS